MTTGSVSNTERDRAATNAGNPDLAHRAFAVIEVIGVLVVGNMAAEYLIPFLRIRPLGPALQSALQAPKPDFIPLTLGFLETKSVQYGCLLMVAFAVGWWRRRSGPRYYGITTAGKSVGSLVALGIVAFALVALPVKLLWLARQFFDLGQGSPFWALLDKEWTWSFWIFMAAASFAFQPVIEELLFRGYCQRRLEEGFGGIGAIFAASLFFVLGHDQYHHLSAISIGNIATLIPCTVGMGYLFWRTRSIVPGTIVHALLNVPTKGVYTFLLIAVMIAVLIFFRQVWWNLLQDICRQARGIIWVWPALVAGVVISAAIFLFERWTNTFLLFSTPVFAIALLIQFRGVRQFRANPHPKSL